MSGLSDTEFLAATRANRDSRLEEFGRFHKCEMIGALRAGPTFYHNIRQRTVTVPGAQFPGFAGDNLQYRYKVRTLVWSSSNDADPPVSRSGTYTETWDPETDEVSYSGDPYNPVDGYTDTEDHDVTGTTEEIEQTAVSPPPETVTAHHTRTWTVSERWLPSDIWDQAVAALEAADWGDWGESPDEVLISDFFAPPDDPVAVGYVLEAACDNAACTLWQAETRWIAGPLPAGAIVGHWGFYELPDGEDPVAQDADVPLSIATPHDTHTYRSDGAAPAIPEPSFTGPYDAYDGPPYIAIMGPWIGNPAP